MGSDFFDGLGETISRTAKELSGKAEVLYETQKLRNRISGEERVVDKIMCDMGNIVYKQYMDGNAVEGELGELCEKISQHMHLILGLKERMAELKGQKICPGCQKAVERDVAFCPYCGATCPTPEPEEDAGDVIDLEELEQENETAGEAASQPEETEESQEAETGNTETEDAEAGEVSKEEAE